MISAARLQAIIEILYEVLEDEVTPADQIVHFYLKKRRYIGSHDRQYISDMVYAVLRYYFILLDFNYCSNNPKLLILFYLIKIQKRELSEIKKIWNVDSNYAPQPITTAEELLLKNLKKKSDDLGVPHWLLSKFIEVFPDTYEQELQAMLLHAPYDLRVNTLKTNKQFVTNQLDKDEMDWQSANFAPQSIRLNKRYNLSNHFLYKNGMVEIQDEGSQLVSLLVDATPTTKVLDYCAGAGGKTLAIASIMENKGIIVASDTISWRLERAKQRLRRSGVHNVNCKVLDIASQKWLKRKAQQFDRVLLDVPCSGSGTWRRNPDLRIRLDQLTLNNLQKEQRGILEKASILVQKGGRIIYSTCSLLAEENIQNIEWFLQNNADFSILPLKQIWDKLITSTPYPTQDHNFLQLTPYQHGTDGFFVAILEKK